MSSSMSPDRYGKQSAAAESSYGARSDQDNSPLNNMNLNFLKTLTEKKSTRDGQPPKRRGPKPDSKPALTRRQELNRQAQRTHRERKELYIKALEDEVMRLKEVFSNVSQDKDKLAEENKQLKTALQQRGLSSSSTHDEGNSSTPSVGYASTASMSGGYAPGSHSAYTGSTAPSASPSSLHAMGGQQMRHVTAQQSASMRGMDYEQAGIDFVLTLEKPCMAHLPWLLERTAEMGGDGPCGHALMASCPPEAFPELTPDIPFGYTHVNGELNSGQRTWELSKADLATLLDLSSKLNLDGEITPVMAWGMVLGHPRLSELTTGDFQKIASELETKIRCYGFGAVLEEFEVRDALENVFCSKPEITLQMY